jgi:hypothetical protein
MYAHVNSQQQQRSEGEVLANNKAYAVPVAPEATILHVPKKPRSCMTRQDVRTD